MRILIFLIICGYSACKTVDVRPDSHAQQAFNKDATPTKPDQLNSSDVDWHILELANGGARFAAVGSQNSCTGTVIDQGTGDDSPVYVLTNAHCVPGVFLPQNGHIEAPPELLTVDGQEINFSHFVMFEFVDAVLDSIKAFLVANYDLVTRDNTDLALARLQGTTLGKIKTLAINGQLLRPLRLASADPIVGEAVSVVGIPRAGARIDPQVLRKSTCKIREIKAINEPLGPEDQDIIYKSKRGFTHTCSTETGSSGSPVLNSNLEIVALHAGLDNDSKGTDHLSNYAVPTAWLNGCFITVSGTKLGFFSDALPTCKIRELEE